MDRARSHLKCIQGKTPGFDREIPDTFVWDALKVEEEDGRDAKRNLQADDSHGTPEKEGSCAGNKDTIPVDNYSYFQRREDYRVEDPVDKDVLSQSTYKVISCKK